MKADFFKTNNDSFDADGFPKQVIISFTHEENTVDIVFQIEPIINYPSGPSAYILDDGNVIKFNGTVKFFINNVIVIFKLESKPELVVWEGSLEVISENLSKNMIRSNRHRQNIGKNNSN